MTDTPTPETQPANRLDGPRLAPLSGSKAKQLIVFLHGYGADGLDLIGLGREWQSLLPDAAFVSPHAPEPCAMNPFGGRQWFPLTFRDAEEYWRGVQQAAPVLDQFLDDELNSHSLADKDLALVGFSQGTMMALHTGLRRKETLAAIVGYSGMLAGPGEVEKEMTGKPPVLLAHGEADDVIPVVALNFAREALTKAGLSVQSHISPALGHGIDGEGLRLAGEFLQTAFNR